uniref:Exonuclease domain-containing protein n=1 Tax=Plectus sambesii TaxID=2011161 RepID=A0A914X2S1_9BILA
MNGATRPPVNTYVFIDTETTGIFSEDPANLNNWNGPPVPGQRRDNALKLHILVNHTDPNKAPHLTEVALLAVPRELLEDAIARLEADEDEVVPTAVNVHTRQIRPNLSEEEWNSYRHKQVANRALLLKPRDLQLKASFAEEWPGIRHFLTTIPKPACLIAHYGLGFDFRLLSAEFERNKIPKNERLPDGVFFVDSYLMALDIESDYQKELKQQMTAIDWSKVKAVENMDGDVQLEPDQTDDGATTEPADVDMNAYRQEPGSSYSTPPRAVRDESASGLTTDNQRARRRLLDGAPTDSPTRCLSQATWSPAKKLRVNKDHHKLFRRNNSGGWSFDPLMAQAHFKTPKFKLQTLYEELVGGTFNAHRAEDDCWALMKVCLTYGRDFVTYADCFYCQFPEKMNAN